MKGKRVNRKAGASEVTEKDLIEQTKREKKEKKELEMKIRAKKRKAIEGKGMKGGGGNAQRKTSWEGRRGRFELQQEIMNHE